MIIKKVSKYFISFYLIYLVHGCFLKDTLKISQSYDGKCFLYLGKEALFDVINT